ncbi:MAG: twin-arginine translocase subunit TatC [Acidobacteriota bacterium]|nr:twin-arginine translocase subunit TatC [Acidobacteriota bacterium]
MDTATTSNQSGPIVTWDHVISRINALRRSLLWVVAALLLGTAAGWGVADRVFNFLAAPLTTALANATRDPRLAFTSLSDPFIIYFSVSLLLGLLLALPVIMSLFWRIVAPLGLGRGAVKAVVFVAASSVLFLVGLAFGYWVLLPIVVRYLLGVAEEFRYAVTIREYLRFALRMLIAMGMSAQLPLISFVLARFELVTARRMLRWLPYAVLAAFVIAAVITPPDGISQLLVATPMMVLYLLGVVVAAVAAPRN